MNLTHHYYMNNKMSILYAVEHYGEDSKECNGSFYTSHTYFQSHVIIVLLFVYKQTSTQMANRENHY